MLHQSPSALTAATVRPLYFNGTTYDNRRVMARDVALWFLAPCEPSAAPWERDRRFFWFFVTRFSVEALAACAPLTCPIDGHELDLTTDEMIAAFQEVIEYAGKRPIDGKVCLNQARIEAHHAALRRRAL
jgi:hypothetical protein